MKPDSATKITAREIKPRAVYKTNEAAALLRVKPETICRAVRRGKLRGSGRPFRFIGAELLRFAGEVAQ